MGNEIPAVQLRRKYFEDMGMEEKYWKPMTLQQKNVWPREDITFREVLPLIIHGLTPVDYDIHFHHLYRNV